METPRSNNTAHYLIVASALVVKAIALAQLASHPVLQPSGNLDDAVYVQLAQRVASGDLTLAPDAYFLPPFYTYFLGLVFAITNGSLLAARAIQVLLGAAAVLLVMRTACTWFGERPALVSGVLAATTGLFAFNEVLILQSALDPFLTALAFWALGRALASRSSASFAIAGLACGALVLNRPNALVCLVVVGVLWVVLTRTEEAVRQIVALALGSLVLIAPVALRNRMVTGEWVMVTAHGGLNFYIGNGPGADGLWRRIPEIRDDINGQVADARRVATAALGHPATASETSSYFYGLGWSWIASNPRNAARLFARKLALTFNGDDIPVNFSYAYFARDERTILRWLITGPWLIIPLGLVGLVLAAPRRQLPGYVTWASVVASYAASVAAFFVTSRYRLPLLVPLLMTSGAAVVWIWDAVRLRNTGRVIVGASAAIAIAVFVNRPSGVDDGRIVEREGHILRLIADGRYDEGERLLSTSESRDPRPGRLLCRVGLAFRDRNDLERALSYMQRAAMTSPDDGWIRFHLGETLLAMNRFDDGLAELRRVGVAPGVPAGELAIDLAGAYQALGHVDAARNAVSAVPVSRALTEVELLRLGEAAVDLGDPATAERFLRTLAVRAPDDARGRELLGTALGMQRRDGEALVELQTAVQLDPASASAHLHLAAGFAQTGRFSDARQQIAEALRLRPGYTEAQALLARLGDRR